MAKLTKLKCKDFHIIRICSNKQYIRFFWRFFVKVTGKSEDSFRDVYGFKAFESALAELEYDFGIYIGVYEHRLGSQVLFIPRKGNLLKNFMQAIENVSFKNYEKFYIPKGQGWDCREEAKTRHAKIKKQYNL